MGPALQAPLPAPAEAANHSSSGATFFASVYLNLSACACFLEFAVAAGLWDLRFRRYFLDQLKQPITAHQAPCYLAYSLLSYLLFLVGQKGCLRITISDKTVRQLLTAVTCTRLCSSGVPSVCCSVCVHDHCLCQSDLLLLPAKPLQVFRSASGELDRAAANAHDQEALSLHSRALIELLSCVVV